MTRYAFDTEQDTGPALGLIVLQTDLRIESDFRRLLPDEARLFVSRVPSGDDVTPETLAQMEAHIPAAARLLPPMQDYAAVGYGCTSGTAQIGAGRVHDLVRAGARADMVTDPLSALVAACAALDIRRLAFLSPYVETVSNRLRDALRDAGVQSPVFGSFDEAEEARVARITPASLRRAGADLAGQGGVDGIFLSCTNLNTLDVIAPLARDTGLAVLSSNLVLCWHMCAACGLSPRMGIGIKDG